MYSKNLKSYVDTTEAAKKEHKSMEYWEQYYAEKYERDTAAQKLELMHKLRTQSVRKYISKNMDSLTRLRGLVNATELVDTINKVDNLDITAKEFYRVVDTNIEDLQTRISEVDTAAIVSTILLCVILLIVFYPLYPSAPRFAVFMLGTFSAITVLSLLARYFAKGRLTKLDYLSCYIPNASDVNGRHC